MTVSMLKSAQRAVVALAAVAACAGAQAAGQAADYQFGQSQPAVPGGLFTLSWFDTGVGPALGFDDTTLVLAFDSSVFSVVGATAGAMFGPAAGFAAPQPVQVDMGGGLMLDGLQYAVSGNGSTLGSADPAVFHVELKLNAAVAPGTVSALYFINPYEGAPVGGTYYDFASQGVAVTAVPEPATVASMLGGLALLAGLKARRKTARPLAA